MTNNDETEKIDRDKIKKAAEELVRIHVEHGFSKEGTNQTLFKHIITQFLFRINHEEAKPEQQEKANAEIDNETDDSKIFHLFKEALQLCVPDADLDSLTSERFSDYLRYADKTGTRTNKNMRYGNEYIDKMEKQGYTYHEVMITLLMATAISMDGRK